MKKVDTKATRRSGKKAEPTTPATTTPAAPLTPAKLICKACGGEYRKVADAFGHRTEHVDDLGAVLAHNGRCPKGLLSKYAEQIRIENKIKENNTMPVKKTSAKKASTKTTKAPVNAADLIFGRFRPDSVGGKMVTLLLDGKAHGVDEIAKATSIKSKGNILATGGWLPLLKKFGQQSGHFDVTRTAKDELVLTVTKPVEKTAGTPAKKKAAAKAEAPAPKAAAKSAKKKAKLGKSDIIRQGKSDIIRQTITNELGMRMVDARTSTTDLKDWRGMPDIDRKAKRTIG